MQNISQNEIFDLELISIPTETYPLEGLFYRPKGEPAGAILLMHGNCMNFYTGMARFLPPTLARLGYACLAYNRRGHDVIVTLNSREPGGGAFQRIDESIDDNRLAAQWLRSRGFEAPLVIGHSNGGMLAARHVVDHPETPALVLMSAHLGGRNMVRMASAAGLLAGDQLDEISARARALVSAGKGREFIALPGWYYVVTAESFLDFLDKLPSLVELAPHVRCPVLFIRGDQEPMQVYPAEEFSQHAGGPCEVRIVSDCDHFYTGRELAVSEVIGEWLGTRLP